MENDLRRILGMLRVQAFVWSVHRIVVPSSVERQLQKIRKLLNGRSKSFV